MSPLLLIIVIIFLAGLFFCARHNNSLLIEGLTNNSSNDNKATKRCPNILVQVDSKFYLYNSRVAKVPGVNPIEFNNLEEYTEFLDWQKSQGIKCPVLYLQKTYDAQGEQVYKVRPSVSDLHGGLPPSPPFPNTTKLVDATHSDMPYNKQSYPSYDQTDYYVGTTTPLEMMNYEQQASGVSPNPMDPNWGGADYTQKLVDAGYYAENEVAIRVA
jgi:hypothetical protein